MLRILSVLLATATLALARPAVEDVATATDPPCTTGAAVVTAGYTIKWAPAIPTESFGHGYRPEPAWARDHVVGTYTFGVPMPIESGFAYAQFKCQYYCNAQTGAGSFFVDYAGKDSRAGSYCNCYDELLDPESFVENNQTVVGAWNAICKA
ncbi:hypothetical protein F5Y15DRAFT_413424 [Xylariaceae sp. FL0016]|nr:hypothetical protein F5Y15DRAFT_413424 [Xylariaceae sp. FL0016]